jgi:hypothetical protein
VSDANKTAMRQFFERVYNQGDIAFLDELTTPEFVSHDRGNPTNDREGVKQIVGAIKAAFPDVEFTADDVMATVIGSLLGSRCAAPRPGSSWVCRRQTSRSSSLGSTSFASKAVGPWSIGTSGAAWSCSNSSGCSAPTSERLLTGVRGHLVTTCSAPSTLAT